MLQRTQEFELLQPAVIYGRSLQRCSNYMTGIFLLRNIFWINQYNICTIEVWSLQIINNIFRLTTDIITMLNKLNLTVPFRNTD